MRARQYPDIESPDTLEEALAEGVRVARENEQSIACVMIRFASLGEALAAGDPRAQAARQTLLERARRVTRASDRLLVTGSDQALLLIVGADRERLKPLLQRLAEQARAVKAPGVKSPIELRFGVAWFPANGLPSPELLLVTARRELASSKAAAL